MSLVKSAHSKPEILVRQQLHKLGYRFRLHYKKLPGKPDIVLPKYMSVILVNGCFWHHHKGCKKSKLPQNNRKFWTEKIMANVARDKRVLVALETLGWRFLVIWECEVTSPTLPKRLIRFL